MLSVLSPLSSGGLNATGSVEKIASVTAKATTPTPTVFQRLLSVQRSSAR